MTSGALDSFAASKNSISQYYYIDMGGRATGVNTKGCLIGHPGNEYVPWIPSLGRDWMFACKFLNVEYSLE